MRLAPLPLLLLLLLLLALVAWLVLGLDAEPTPAGIGETSASDDSGVSPAGLRGAAQGASPKTPSAGGGEQLEPLSPWPIGEPDADAPGEGLVYVRLVDGEGDGCWAVRWVAHCLIAA